MNITDNLYEILEVSKDASLDDIKRAYKKLALKYHPDKCGNAQKETFIKISNAYHILSDPAKKAKYDLISKEEVAYFGDTFQKLFTLLLTIILNHTQNRKEIIKDLIMEIPVELDELYHRSIKKISIKVCRIHSGKQKYESIPLYLSLFNYKKQYIYNGIGDEYLVNDEVIKTNVILNIKIVEHPFIHIDNILTHYDLHIQKEITLYQYYYGYTETINYFGSELIIKYDGKFISSTLNNDLRAIIIKKDLGLPYYDKTVNIEQRGDLYIFLSVKLPCELNKEDNDFERFLKTYFN